MGEVEPEVEVCLDLQKTFVSSSTSKIVYKARRESGEEVREGERRGDQHGTGGNAMTCLWKREAKGEGVKPISLAGEMQTVNSLGNQS